MKQYQVRLYQSQDFELWNTFITEAKNATFLFHRDFMEYHKDRFEDYSLLVFDEDKLIALLPANRVGQAVYSHQGLTYGGLIYSDKTKTEKVESIINSIIAFLNKNAIKELIIKPILAFFADKMCQEIDYFLYQKGAELYRKDLNLTINLSLPISISKSKLKHFRKEKTQELTYVEETDFSLFWNKVLEPRMKEKHNLKPVHNLKEITYLHSKFPDNIKQFSVYYENEIIAGITIFESSKWVKSQYGATTEKGEELRALDFLYINLIEKYKNEGKLYFDMGIVNEQEGKVYNKGLLQQKEELGCTVYNQDYYKLTLNG